MEPDATGAPVPVPQSSDPETQTDEGERLVHEGVQKLKSGVVLVLAALATRAQEAGLERGTAGRLVSRWLGKLRR